MSFLRSCTCTVKTHYPSQKPTHNPSLSHTYVHHQSSHKNFTLNKNVTDIHMQYVPIRSFGLKMTFSTTSPVRQSSSVKLNRIYEQISSN